jgi:hypothetical protein
MRPLILAAPILTVLASGAWGQPFYGNDGMIYEGPPSLSPNGESASNGWQPGLIGGDPPDLECGTGTLKGPDGKCRQPMDHMPIGGGPMCLPSERRTYTPAEIDRMREFIYDRWPSGGGIELQALTELRLQTYIVAGVSPEALETEWKKP